VGVLALLGTGNVSILFILAGAVAGPLVYFLALLALRELTLDDIQVFRRILARQAPT
jgi:hypothetical protein